MTRKCGDWFFKKIHFHKLLWASVAPFNPWERRFTQPQQGLYYFHCQVYYKPFLNVVPPVGLCVCVCVCACGCLFLYLCVYVCMWTLCKCFVCECVCVIRGRNWIRDGSVATVRWKYHRGSATCPVKSHPPTTKASPLASVVYNT